MRTRASRPFAHVSEWLHRTQRATTAAAHVSVIERGSHVPGHSRWAGTRSAKCPLWRSGARRPGAQISSSALPLMRVELWPADFHFSHDPSIKRFVPHVPVTNPGQPPLVPNVVAGSASDRSAEERPSASSASRRWADLVTAQPHQTLGLGHACRHVAKLGRL